MAVIGIDPIVLRDASLTIGADSYESNVSGVTFTPSSSVVSWSGLTPEDTYSFPGVTTWTCDLEYAQDWTTADSLSRYLHENEGEAVTAVFEPKNGDPAVTATIVIAPGAIGGTVNTVAVGSVSLGVNGKPAVAPVA